MSSPSRIVVCWLGGPFAESVPDSKYESFRECDDCSGDASNAVFLAASSLDIAVFSRSGKVEDKAGRASTFSIDGVSSRPVNRTLSTPSIELERDLDLRLELENIEEIREVGRDRDSSPLTLDDLLELPKGCFLVSLRDSLLRTETSLVRSASSSLSIRFSSSSLSASRRFVARLSFFSTTEWLTLGDWSISCVFNAPFAVGESFTDWCDSIRKDWVEEGLDSEVFKPVAFEFDDEYE